MLADELSLLLEGARVTAQSMGRDGLGDRLIRMGEAYGGGVWIAAMIARRVDAAGFTDRSQLLVGTG